MIREWLIHIVEESFEAMEGSSDVFEELTKEQKALNNINIWANQLYNEQLRERWFRCLEVVEWSSWGGFEEDKYSSRVCPCGEKLCDKLVMKDGEYYSERMWIDEHYPHDTEYAKQVRAYELQILDERDKRKSR
jgi:hypothetical protein